MGRVLALSLALWISPVCRAASEATVTKTNWSTRWITNLIEVNMPVNRFVDVYVTNRVTRMATNVMTVQAVQTNFVVMFRTNWNMVTVTNRVAVEEYWTNRVVAYETNRIMRTQTNVVAVNAVQTNYVTRCQTNWSPLTLTNWETVVMFRTNWLTRSATNVVDVDAPRPVPRAASAAAQAGASSEAPGEELSGALAAGWAGPVAIEAVRSPRSAGNGLVEVLLKARWTSASTAPLQVQQWRVEREDAAVLLFSQDRDFRRQLPAGKYKVEARLKPEGGNPPAVARGTLSVSPQEVVVLPRLLVKK